MSIANTKTDAPAHPAVRTDEAPDETITPAQRAAAARIRIAANKKLGRPTEAWIRELAKSA